MTFQSALSGLNAASSNLNVTGNNIANAGTTGFKRSRIEFSDLFADTIGAGVQVANIRQQFEQGNISFTENTLDLAISGDGFFTLNDNGTNVYSRSGAFGVNKDGFIVDNKDFHLKGFVADVSGVLGAEGDLKISSASIDPKATTAITLGANLAASETAPAAIFSSADPATYNHSTSITLHDSLGTAHSATLYYRKTADNTWDQHIAITGGTIAEANDGKKALVFDASTGKLTSVGGVAGTDTTYNFTPTGGTAIALKTDLASLTQFGNSFNISTLTQDGFAAGQLTDIAVDGQGKISGLYSNGQSKVLGQVTLAKFSNPEGLKQLGDNLWATTVASGTAISGASGTSGLGQIQSGALEDSNVNITGELVNLITAQRSFQANAQVISATDQLTQTIINLR